ncbi:tRNA (guanine-N(7)-)-methyltransferase [Desulfonispora thiosulfatigenes DSM 11270]|uniref:tRNA (guanine-N(7)-)-methyltransferase n=1 Tax=Desulfonispora thiosulfatigenes DSM 11270 TaxID=656914 RepID=A0A1W1V432_DESTI|nr:tRNA (guanosine(46)-N7)-methyltransferase TrmB [Desulfonispora thiosulfatigenes]SMB88046.1 tRNA (guanine-N(7)-)-methyltransferase [Desulfonispora thiosulfatigenes DSM 11270]
MGRIRKKVGTKEELLSYSPPIALNPETNKGKWRAYFGNSNPIHIEIGTGKGTFITTLASRNPEINYLGFEKVEEVLLLATKKAINLNLKNMGFIWGDVSDILEYFAPEEIDRLYINFCDPWPKKRHEKRRLTYRDFLDFYQQILKPEGEIHYKTDNEGLFQSSLNEFCHRKWNLKNISLNLYKDLPEDNVATEYETKFVGKGSSIFRLEANIPD